MSAAAASADRELVAPDALADRLWLAGSQRGNPGALLVDLTLPLAAGWERQRALQAAAMSPYPMVGVADGEMPAQDLALAQALTVSFASAPAIAAAPPFVAAADPLDAARSIAGVVRARPLACAALGMLLQQTGILPVWEGLVAESATYSTLLAGPEFGAWLRAAPTRAPAPDDDEPVLARRTGDVLRLSLNRPERRNAYGHRMRDALVSALQVALVDEAVVVELDGIGPAFCSGGDLAEFGTAPDPATAHAIRLRQSAGALLHQLAARTTVRLHGACIGAGIELPAFAGRVRAAADTSIGLPEIGMGLVPGAGGTVSIVRRIGRWRTAWLALSGERIDAAQALRWGLVDDIISGTDAPA